MVLHTVTYMSVKLLQKILLSPKITKYTELNIIFIVLLKLLSICICSLVPACCMAICCIVIIDVTYTSIKLRFLCGSEVIFETEVTMELPQRENNRLQHGYKGNSWGHFDVILKESDRNNVKRVEERTISWERNWNSYPHSYVQCTCKNKCTLYTYSLIILWWCLCCVSKNCTFLAIL